MFCSPGDTTDEHGGEEGLDRAFTLACRIWGEPEDDRVLTSLHPSRSVSYLRDSNLKAGLPEAGVPTAVEVSLCEPGSLCRSLEGERLGETRVVG